MKCRRQNWIAVALSFALYVGDACAQTSDAAGICPNKPIRIIVGFTPGGGPEITARYVAQKLSEAWKQQVIVDNRRGAGGTLGVKQRWIPIGLEPRPTTPVEFDRLVAGDIDLFTKIARAANIRAE